MKNIDYVQAIGKYIRKLRHETGLSILKFSAICDISPTYIDKIELGKVNVSIDILISICYALEIEPYLLLREAKFTIDDA